VYTPCILSTVDPPDDIIFLSLRRLISICGGSWIAHHTVVLHFCVVPVRIRHLHSVHCNVSVPTVARLAVLMFRFFLIKKLCPVSAQSPVSYSQKPFRRWIWIHREIRISGHPAMWSFAKNRFCLKLD
jgi:hypothetical protein